MTGIFRQKSPGNLIMLFIIGALLKLPVFFHPRTAVVRENDGILYPKLIGFLNTVTGNSVAVHPIIAFVLLFVQMNMLTRFINSNRLIQKPNFLPGMAFILISSLIPQFNYLSSSLIASLFFLGAFILVFKTHHPKTIRGSVFNAGLLIGIASLFFLPALFFMVWVFIALALLKPFKITDCILILLAVTTPYYFYSIYLYLTNHFQIPAYFSRLSFGGAGSNFSMWYTWALFLFMIPLAAGIYYAQSSSSKMLLPIRRSWYLFAAYLVICAMISFCNATKDHENWVMVLVPAAAFHGYGYFYTPWKLYPKIAFWITVVFIIATQFYSGLW